MSLKKIEQLIALAVSTTHEEEARTSALLAVRMIKKEEIRLTEKGTTAQEPPFPFGVPGSYSNVAAAQAAEYERHRAAYERMQKEWEERAAYSDPFGPRGTSYGYTYGTSYGYRASEPNPDPVRPPEGGTWVTLQTGMPIPCVACSNYINPGDRCYVDKRKRVWCAEH